MTPNDFKDKLAPMVAANRDREARAFVQANLASVRAQMTPEDRMLVADWMEGVETAFEVEWLSVAARNPAFADLADPAEDVYTLEDGKPFIDRQ